jgi:hypothetical protein
MPRQIFISYSRQDTEVASFIRRYLEQHGYLAWFDTHSIHVGDEWPAEIVDGIKECVLFLLVISPHAIASRQIKKEVFLASEEKKTILPLMIPPPCQLSDGLRYHLAGLQQMELDLPKGLPNLLSRIQGEISDVGDSLKFDHTLLDLAPDIKIRSFPLRPTLGAMLRTLVAEVPRHLLQILQEEQEHYYLARTIPEHRENALRCLRNHGLLEHDGQWLFTPTRSQRVWATPVGELLIELNANRGSSLPDRVLRSSYEAIERVAAIEDRPDAVRALEALHAGADISVDPSFRVLRNLSLITYQTLSSNVPLLHEMTRAEFYVTELGQHVLRTLGSGRRAAT